MKTTSRALAAIPALLLVGACGIGGASNGTKSADAGSGGSSSGSDSMIGAPEPAPAEGTDSGKTSGGDAGRSASQAAAIPPMSRAVISTGQVTVHPKSLNRARSEVMRLVDSWNGSIANEQTSSDDRGRLVDSTMTLRVPTEKFSEAMNSLAGLGKVEQQSRKSEDVTTQVIDNAARVRAAERSIRQIERLLNRAKQLGDIIAIESDLARRQADLDSLKSQQAWLNDQTSLSTINVYLSRPPEPAKHEPKSEGFLAGLGQGWSALGTAMVVLLTIVGAALPFAAVVALLGVPLWLVVRRRRQPAPPVPSEA